jgi:hypothetical protein
MKFKASISHHSSRYNFKTHRSDYEKVVTEIEDDDAASFKKKVSGLFIYGSMPCTLATVRKCSLDGIAVSRQEFIKTIEDAQRQSLRSLLKSAPPMQYLGLTDVHSRLCHLRQVGNEILVGTPPKEEEFYKKLEEFYLRQDGTDTQIKTLYHGTVASAVGNILLNGFKVSSRGALGRGLYVGPYDKAMGFNGKGMSRTGGKGSWSRHGRTSIYGYIFELDVLTGKCQRATQSGGPFPKEFDSVYYTGFNKPEYCLKEASQVLIKKIIIVT